MKTLALAANLALTLYPIAFGSETTSPPVLEFASGLAGRQVHLTWPATPGLQYRVQKSSTLSSDGGGWTLVALVRPTTANAAWTDPEPTTTRCFYRISQPEIEVTSISPPLLSSSGGSIHLNGQCIPAGSVLIVEIEGQAPISIPLGALGGGIWEAIISGTFVPGSRVLATRIEDSVGTTLLTLNTPLEVTATGRATDIPPSLPPAAPISAGVSAVDVAIKTKGTGADKDRVIIPGRDNDCDGFDAGLVVSYLSKKGYDYYKAQSDNAAVLVGKGSQTVSFSNSAPGTRIRKDSQIGRSSAYSKKGYDYYAAQSSMAAAAHTNPYFVNNEMVGEMAIVAPNPSSRPGEVSFRSCPISLPCPAGPALAWVSTYRSLVPTSSGHGPGWDFSYNISIEPLPASDGASAARLLLRDGAGHTDTLHRQADGTYRCDGMFREGSFTGSTFTLSFADQGTWTFKPLGASTDSGKIAAITDRNNVALTCDYNPDGTLASVTDDFGRSLSVEWSVSAPVRILAVSSGSGGSVYLRTEFVYGGNSGSLTSMSCPFVPGEAPVCNPTTFTYDSAATDPRLADNLLSVTDGAGRAQTFGYSSSTVATAIDYDVCTSSHAYGSAASPPHTSSFELLPDGNYQVAQCDEVGRVIETVCDRLHRVLSSRQYTGFATPGVPVTSTTNRPAGKLRAGDPDFFETTCAYNSHHLPTRVTHPDGSQDRVTYACDLDPACAVRERANPRVMTIATSVGETRTVSCDYLPGFGDYESARPGNPIGGLTIKGGRNPGGGMSHENRPGAPIKGVAVKGGRNLPLAASRLTGGGIDNDCYGFAALLKKEEGGRHTPFQNRSSVGGISGGVVAGIVVAAREGGGITHMDDWSNNTRLAGGVDNDCGGPIDDGLFRKILDRGEAGDNVGFVTSMHSSLGQTTTWSYDFHGNCTAETSPVPGRGALYEYNARGQCTAATTLNGAASAFRDEFTYDAGSGFPTSAVCDSTGLALTTIVLRDDLGRVTRVTDPRGSDTLFAYNPLHQCVQVSSPPTPVSIVTTLTIDSGGYPVRCDTEHRAPDGSLDSANPAYSSDYFYDTVGQLIRVAHEDRPTTDFDELSIGEFMVCDITYNPAGEVTRLSTPAACRNQATDRACTYSYDERGFLHRVHEGDTGNPGATGIVTTECDYDADGNLTRCATLVDGGISPECFYTYDGFHRPTSITDPMGNVATYTYANDGYVTCSIFGELIDVAGSAGNVLLSRSTYLFGTDLSGDKGPAGLTLPSVPDACYSFNVATKKSSGREARWSRVKNQASLQVRCAIPFFTFLTEDESITVERFSPNASTPPDVEVTAIDRSPAGLVQSVTLNGDLQLACTYDSAGRLATCSDDACTTAVTRDPNGNVLSATRTDLTTVAGAPNKTFTTACVYDALGRCVSVTDGTGNAATLSYDSLHRLVEFFEPGGLVITTEYDGASTTGQPFSSRTIVPDVDNDGIPDVVESSLVRSGELLSTTDSYSHTTTCTRDSLGRLIRCDFPDATFEEISYDALGRVLSQLHQDDSVCTFQYDLNSRATGTTWTSPPAIPAANPPAYQYDGLGRCVSASQGGSVVSFTYDSLGNPTSETQDGQTISRTFTHRGRSKITYPDGKAFAESRDGLGQLLSISAINSATGQPVSPPVVALQYAGHRVLRSTQANGVVTTHTYRADGELALPGAPDASFDACVRTTVSNASSTVLTDTLHRRDPNQRDTACEMLFSSGVDAAGRSKTFTRDALGRVVACVTERREVTGGPLVPDSDVGYTLDIEGRRLSATGGSNPGAYLQASTLPPGDEQMGRYTVWPGGPLQWDDAGNLALFSNGASGQLSFVHDAEGRLLAVNDPNTGSAVVTYTYDALGRRISRSTGGGGLPPATTSFIYDGGECIQELDDDGTGSISANLTFVASGGIKHCISTRAGTYLYPHASPAATERGGCPGGGRIYPKPGYGTDTITNSTGAVVERLDCDDACKPIFLDAAGLPTKTTSSTSGLRWLSPACAWEPEIGMLAGPGGVYSPSLGCFVTKDKDKPKPKPVKGGGGIFRPSSGTW